MQRDPIPARCWCLLLDPSPNAHIYHQLNSSEWGCSFSPEGYATDLILKKCNLYVHVVNNRHPISNFPYIGPRLVKHVIIAQLNDYMSQNKLPESLPSVYCKVDSTIAGIAYIFSEFLCATDNNTMVFISLLDCSASFDLVDHSITPNHLEH